MDELIARLEPIFRDILDDPNLTLTAESSARTIEQWDSLAHISIVSAIEQEFKIRFALGELEVLNNVGEMVELMQKKLAR